MGKINRPTLFGFAVTSLSVLEPRVDRFPIDPSSAPVRWGDPVKQIAGGTIVRCTPADTVLLGFAATSDSDVLPSTIAHIGPKIDKATGLDLIMVYLADALNVFSGDTVSAPTQANVLQAHDLAYAVPTSPTPTITNGGAAGGTTYTYYVEGVTANGAAIAGAAGSTTTGNPTLSAANYNIVTIPFTTRAASYNVYRGNTLIGNVGAGLAGAATVFNDTGLAAQAGTKTTNNMSGWLVNNTANSTGVVQVRSISTKPQPPFVGNTSLGGVLFSIPTGISQVQGVAGS